MSRLYLGIDVAAESFVAACYDPAGSRRVGCFRNTRAGFRQLCRQLRALGHDLATVTLALEPTGGYESALVGWAYAVDWQVARVNPRRVRAWGRGLGQRAKSDAQDAELLAHYAAHQARPEEPVPEPAQELESLLRRQKQLEIALDQERNRRRALRRRPHAHPDALASLERHLDYLKQELAAVKQAIERYLAAQPEPAAAMRHLRGVPGIGSKISAVLWVRFQRFEARTCGQGTAKGVTAFIGLDPCTHESGSSIARPAHISRMGDGWIRDLLFMGAMSAVQGNNPLRTFYERLVARGKSKKLALVACARKMLVWAWAVYRYGKPFDPTRHPAPAPKPA